MKRFKDIKKKFFLAILILLLGFSYNSAQINLPAQFNTAEKLFKAELYFDAITEYKRLLCFDSIRQFEYQANLKIGICYKEGGKYNDAIPFLIKAEKSAPGKDQKFDAAILIVRVNILRRTTGRALELLGQLETGEAEKSKIDEIKYWRGWAFMFADDFEKGAACFAQTPLGDELKKICLNAHSDKYSVTFAKVISYILPGAGQFYTGEILSGIMSLGWNVLFGLMTVNAFIENRVFDGILVGDLLFLRFYRGNLQNAEKFAIEKNLEITNKTLLYIQNNYKGIKP